MANIKAYLGLFAAISLGVFLFVLFFQPFPLDRFDFNNRILFVAGLGAIVFLLLISRIILPWRKKLNQQEDNETIYSTYFADLLLLVFISVAFAFYLRYVGYIGITFFIMFKVALISLAAMLVLRVTESFRDMKNRYELLKKHQISVQQQLEQHEDDLLSKKIEIISENRNENLTLQIADIAFIRSADNYVEVFYRVDKNIKKELIRNTLKNIEQQVKPYNRFVRCHRTCIVNSHYIDKLNSTFNNYWLSLRDVDEQIPVSRQYLLSIKEII